MFYIFASEIFNSKNEKQRRKIDQRSIQFEKFFSPYCSFFFLDQILDETAVLQQAEDEAKRILSVEKRNEQVRQLFRKQAIANRFKVFLFQNDLSTK